MTTTNETGEARVIPTADVGGTVVIVDDNPNNLRVLSNILEQQGFKVRPALNGEMALRSITMAPPELVLLDIRMPEMDGFEVCRRLKLDERTRDVPVIFISALNETEDKISAFRAGGVDYIAKPFQMEEVMARVQAHLKLYRMQVQLESLVAERTGELRTAYASLQRSEAQYRRLVENAPDILYIYSNRHGGRYYSARVEAVLGWTPDHLLANPLLWRQRIHPEDLPRVDAAIAAAVTSQPFDLEYRIQDAAGGWHWLHDRSISIQQREGELLIEGLASDITDRKQAEVSLHRANRALHTLSACNAALIRVENEGQLLNEVCRTLVEVGEYRMALVVRPGEPGAAPHVQAVQGHDAGFAAEFGPAWAARVIAASNGQARVEHAIDALPEGTPGRAAALERGYAAAATLPLQFDGDPQGWLLIFSTQSDSFDDRELELLRELAADLAFGLSVLHTRQEHQHNMERLEATLIDTIRMMALTIEKRDPYTAGHMQRVAELARAIAQDLGLDKTKTMGIYLGGLIHDIGKIYIPAEILSRPGRISAIELNLIRTHAQVGYEIVSGVEFNWPIAQMIHQHHERLDGSGYPRGLSGDQVILEARILAVADVVESMASHRPYRPALGLDAALEEIESHQGGLYDPVVVASCARLFREGRFQLD